MSIYKYTTIPGLFSPNWFEQIINSSNEPATDASRIYYADTTYPYNIILTKDDNDNPSEYTIEIALAGIGKDNISVKVRDGKLLINITRPEDDVPDDTRQYLRRGISQKKSSVSFTLSKDVDNKNIKSTYVDGLLQITVPCIQPETQNIDINVD